ncbi:hypothetical protein KC316_g2439 [Hortaea werneckii]|nr:hypothetical protein KC316_g2439 [Hortaea werneckii]RMX98060.1 hypothetical protein D0868_10306 [Hortaea werneckii]
MGPRPENLNLDNDHRSDTPQKPRFPFQMDLPSPRAGEVPPALSPLDAFAMHSRILARQFEQEKNGRRISRLPYNVVSQELANRPGYFRSTSGGSESNMSTMSEVPEILEDGSPTSPGKAGMAISGDEVHRPKSFYPMMGHANQPSIDNSTATPFFDASEQPQDEEQAPQGQQQKSQGYFDMPRAASPEAVDPKLNVAAPSPMVPSLTNSMDSLPSTHPRTMTDGSTNSQRSFRSERGGLLRPKSPAFPKSPRSAPGIRAVRQDSGDEEGSQYGGAAVPPSVSRKFSNSSNMSRPHSPFSPFVRPVHRSPSMNSEHSTTGQQGFPPLEKPRAPFNFSRPLSSSGQSLHSSGPRPSFDSRPSFDTRPSAEGVQRQRKASGASSVAASSLQTRSNPSTRQNSADDVRQQPANIHIDTPPVSARPDQTEFPESGPQPAPSYVYAKYALPRGRTVDRDSDGARESWIHHQFNWDDKKPQLPLGEAVDSRVLAATNHDVFHQRKREDSDLSNYSAPVRPASPANSTGSEKISGTRLSRLDRPQISGAARSRSANPDTRMPSNLGTAPVHRSEASVQSGSTGRTIRPMPPTALHQRALSTELTPDEHLEIGIQTHSSGNLNKSTYHLRLAARAGLPTAMLLYALACRHGWGMRPNQEEGVSWLRRAIESSGLEFGDVEATVSNVAQRTASGPSSSDSTSASATEAQERKNRRAQFALAIYELGISYMNGWGCSKDKTLALRCYEVAGSWGDCDALAEAGFCYTQGMGCKKDLKKAAALYRKAAEGGMSMAGNSWIYKPKYMEDAPSLEELGKGGLGPGAGSGGSAGKGKSPEKSRQQLQRQGTPKREESPGDFRLRDPKEKERPTQRARGRSIWGRKKEKA